MDRIRKFVADENGATAIEYGLIAGLVAVALILAFTFFGQQLLKMFEFVRDRSSSVYNGAGV